MTKNSVILADKSDLSRKIQKLTKEIEDCSDSDDRESLELELKRTQRTEFMRKNRTSNIPKTSNGSTTSTSNVIDQQTTKCDSSRPNNIGRRGRPKKSDMSHLYLDPQEIDRRRKLAEKMRRYRRRVRKTETKEEAAKRRRRQTESMRKYRDSLKLNQSDESSKNVTEMPQHHQSDGDPETASTRRRKNASERVKRYLAKKRSIETEDEAAERRRWMADYMREYREKKRNRSSVDSSTSNIKIKQEESSDVESEVISELQSHEDSTQVNKTRKRANERMKRYWAKKLKNETEEEKVERRRRNADYVREYRMKKKMEKISVEPPVEKKPPAYSEKYVQYKRSRDLKLQKETDDQAAERKRIAAQKMKEYRLRQKMSSQFPEFCKFQDRRFKTNKQRAKSKPESSSISSSQSQQRIVYIKSTSQQKLLTLCMYDNTSVREFLPYPYYMINDEILYFKYYFRQ